MMYRRQILLLVILVAGAALVTSTSGVSSVSADRDVQGKIAEDPSAYLGFEQTPTNTADGTTDLEVTVTNQFSSGTDLTVVKVTVNSTTVDLAESDPLESGESATCTFTTVPCDDPIMINASGNGVRVSLDRSVTCN